MQSPKTIKFYLSLFVILVNFAFYYLFAISLKGVIGSFLYFIAAVLLPGYCISALFFSLFRTHTEHQPSWPLMLSLVTIFGIANVVVSYLIGQASHNAVYNYLFAWAYLLVLVRPVRN